MLSLMNCEAKNKPLFSDHIEAEKGTHFLSLWKQMLVISARQLDLEFSKFSIPYS